MAHPSERASPRVGMVVSGTYRLIEHIGAGGMSDVFSAEHVRLGKLFAVKLLRPDVSIARRAAERLRREARAIAALSSEYIVGIQDCGETEDGTPFLVMDLLHGEDLRSLLERKGALPVARTANLVLDACYGLAEVHAQSLVHRDLKPENLFITRHATGEDWCKVLDFGVAKMEASQSTAPGAIVGTIRYMAPEQLADSTAVSAATDVYALGAILYECLSGQPAHRGQVMQELMFQVMNQQPLALGEVRPSVPSGLGELVMQCLEKQPSARPALSELANCLKSFAHRKPAGSDATLADELALPPRRVTTKLSGSRLSPLAVAVGFAGVALGFGAASFRGEPAPAAREPSSSVPRSGADIAAAPRAPGPGDPASGPAAQAAPRSSAPAPADPAAARSAVTPEPASAPARPGATPTKPPGSAPRRPVDIGRFDQANPYQ